MEFLALCTLSNPALHAYYLGVPGVERLLMDQGPRGMSGVEVPPPDKPSVKAKVCQKTCEE